LERAEIQPIRVQPIVRNRVGS